MDFINALSSNVSTQTIIFWVILILIARFFSKFAQSTPARLFWVAIGLYLILPRINYDPFFMHLDIDFFLAIGFILPHIRYFVLYIISFIQSTIAVTYNLYTLWLSIYYKVRNIFLYAYQLYRKIKIYFQKRSYEKQGEEFNRKREKEEQNNYYNKQEYNSSSFEEEQSYNQKEEQTYNNKEETHDKQESNTNDSYQKQSSYTQNPYGAEYDRFYSKEWYIVLGVNKHDDYNKDIKKVYKKLARKYHPDTTIDEEEKKKLDIIFKLINNANDEAKSKRK